MKILLYHKDIQMFINSLEKMVRSKVLSEIETLSIEEYNLNMPFSKKIDKDLYELRIISLQNIRIFYTFYNENIYLLLAINKKTQKLDLNDLKTAKQRLSALQF